MYQELVTDQAGTKKYDKQSPNISHNPTEDGYRLFGWMQFDICGLFMVDVAIVEKIAGRRIWQPRR
jgi:hypothetical protein